MFKKGRKREAKGLAVVYFIIGLIILLIILAVIYFALVELDYSDRIRDPEATIRSYVEMTPAPSDADDELVADSDGYDISLDVDLTAATDTPEPTATPTPEPTATPEPTPSPTPIPVTMVSPSRTSGFSVPETSTPNMVAGITSCYVSLPDNNRYMYMTGYGYLNDATFDGAQAQSYLIVKQSKTGKMIAYQMTSKSGISGHDHSGAVCQNASACDFEACIDVGTMYSEDIYNLGVVVAYTPAGAKKASYAYYAFPSDISFTVLAGQVVGPVFVADAAVAAAEDEMADADVSDFDDADFDEDAFDGEGDEEFDSGVEDVFAPDADASTAPQAVTSSDELYLDQMTNG